VRPCAGRQNATMLSLLSRPMVFPPSSTAPHPNPLWVRSMRWAAARSDFEILKIGLLPRALYESEALGRLGREGRCLQLDRVRELTVDLLTRARVDHQAVRVVHLGPVIIEAAAVGLVEEKHRCKRCDAEDAYFGAWKYRKFHVHQGLDARLHGEAVGAGCRVALEQRVNDDRLGVRSRPFDPEMRECGEFFTGGLSRVDCQPARRKSVKKMLATARK